MLPIHFAPLQGYTDDVYRRIHHRLAGGIETYYTPFLRVEAGGVRTKDLRDLSAEHNVGVPVVPQIILKSVKEFDCLCAVVEEQGYARIDLNMGCPFPMQAKHGRGSGLLAHTEVVEEVARGILVRPHLRFSVKMRLGWEDKEEWRSVLDILNGVPLTHITLHPRIGKDQYKGVADREAFGRFSDACRHPLIYNGDVTSLEQLRKLEEDCPKLAGVMMGRGLLGRPSLAAEYAGGSEWPWEKRRQLLMDMHRALHDHYARTVNSEAQLHAKLRLFWEYAEAELGRKCHKKLMKSGNLKNYLAEVGKIPY